ncbi:MAG: galactose-1-phosphate uridylyltransferase [Thaumarchaeota archaeon]|nr:MAG: galactose-1-phosphate uridylyltransferase [Nitrososphaerota archaeon]
MSKVRKDYFSESFVLFTNEKLDKIKKLKKVVKKKDCPYCPGNEHITGPADLVIISKEGALAKLADEDESFVKDWTVRVFLNKDAIVSPDEERIFSDYPQYSEPAIGYHYVVVLSQKHTIDLSEIDSEQWTNILTTVQDKSRWLYSQKHVSYVAVYMNHGVEAGAEIEHPHLQIVSLPTVPPVIEVESKFMKKPLREKGICPMCVIVKEEESSKRIIGKTENFVMFAPWASKHPYEYWIFPRQHDVSFVKFTQKGISELSEVIHKSIESLTKTLGIVAFNLVVHSSPEKKTSKQIHWHIEIYPRIETKTGLEISSNIQVNKILPEEAAKKLAKNFQK